MTRVQVIEKDGKPDFYVVPADLWERVKGLVEDAEDAAAYAEAVARDDGLRYPAAVARAIAAGATPLRAWRDHRSMTLQVLAEAAGLSKPYLSQIESGKRAGTAATLKKLAAALAVPVAALIL
jgi:antitoxin component HigA of HigAB toxin-antitoxin module